jgi:hypothetical protein
VKCTKRQFAQKAKAKAKAKATKIRWQRSPAGCRPLACVGGACSMANANAAATSNMRPIIQIATGTPPIMKMQNAACNMQHATCNMGILTEREHEHAAVFISTQFTMDNEQQGILQLHNVG